MTLLDFLHRALKQSEDVLGIAILVQATLFAWSCTWITPTLPSYRVSHQEHAGANCWRELQKIEWLNVVDPISN